LVRVPVDRKHTAVTLFIGQDWKKFRVESNFYFFRSCRSSIVPSSSSDVLGQFFNVSQKKFLIDQKWPRLESPVSLERPKTRPMRVFAGQYVWRVW
jgi:hypothetical protein